MLFKMLSIQRTWQRYPDIGPKPRQVFITQSRVLATKVEEYFAKLMSSLEASACSPEVLRATEMDVEQDVDLVDPDDDEKWRSDLPERFSELLDDHFPLFVTYDRVRISSSPKRPISSLVCSSAQCCRTILGGVIITTACPFPRPMPLEMRYHFPQAQLHLGSLGHMQESGVHRHLIICNSPVETSSPTGSFWHLTGITSLRPLPEP